MTGVTEESLVRQIATLQAKVRINRLVALCSLGLMLFLVLGAATSGWQKSGVDVTFGTVRARRVIIEDSDTNPRIDMGTYGPAGTNFIVFYGQADESTGKKIQGRRQLVLRTGRDQSDIEFFGPKERVRMNCRVGASGTPLISLFDKAGRERLALRGRVQGGDEAAVIFAGGYYKKRRVLTKDAVATPPK